MAHFRALTVGAILLIYSLCSPVQGQQHTLTQLTFSDSTHDGYPYWSPDGTHLIYSAGSDSFCRSFIIPSSGGTPNEVIDLFAQHARWSPTGDFIVFDGDFGTSIKMIPASGSSAIRIDPDTVTIERSGMPCISPDGKTMVFKSKYSLYAMDYATGEITEVYQSEDKNAVPYDWWPDGSRILIDARDMDDPLQSDIWELPMNGIPRQLSFLPGRQVKPSISPDGSMIVFSSDHGGNVDLWIMPSQGGDPIQLTHYEGGEGNPGYDIEPSWSPDGKSIAFSSTRDDIWAIWRMDLDLEYVRRSLMEPVNYSVQYPTVDTSTIPLFPFILNSKPLTHSPAASWDTREIIQVKLGEDQYAWFDATAENGDTLNYKKGLKGKGNQVVTNHLDFPSLATTGLHTEEELSTIRSITGKSVSWITVDGRPGGSSGVGFMAEDETILSVILGDNRMVERLGLKHPDLARPLLNGWNIKLLLDQHNALVSSEMHRELSSMFFEGNAISVKISGGRGWQESIFNDEILGSYHLEYWRDLNPEEAEFLSRHYGHLSQADLENLKKMIGTIHTGEMVPYYIYRYGFYEGHTDFRADPVSIAFVFGLRSLETLHEASGGDLFKYFHQTYTENP